SDHAPGGVLRGSGLSEIVVRSGVTLDLSGVWVNALLDQTRVDGLAHLNGGSLTVRSNGDITFERDTLIDVSSGGALLANGTIGGGRGGNVSITAGTPDVGTGIGSLVLDGRIRAYGMEGGGALNITAGQAISIGTSLLETNGILAAGE